VPLLAATGASVTSFDNSPAQLARDREVAEREGLQIVTIEGDMRDLGAFEDESFDLIVNPCSTIFVPELEPVWTECHRVLAPGGQLMTGILKPETFIFDYPAIERGELRVRHALPYSDLESIDEEEREALFRDDEPLCFSHTLEAQLGGQLRAGFVIVDLFEDNWPQDAGIALSPFMPCYLATLARKVT
jgi:SAM-dependent methyltransferase